MLSCGAILDWPMTMRFTLHGSPHSMPTYKVALTLSLARQPFQFSYVSYQKEMHKTPAFRALSRWGQVPVLQDDGEVFLQSAAIIEHLSHTLSVFEGETEFEKRAVREWLYWDADVLFPPIFNCYGVRLGQQKLLPIHVDAPIIAYHRERAERALDLFNGFLESRDFLCSKQPTIADIACCGDIAFAEICEFDLSDLNNVEAWSKRMRALPGFQEPFDLLSMEDALVS